MSFVPRSYEEITRDLFTTLTGGTVRESVPVPSDGLLIPTKLVGRPVRRISHLEGVIAIGNGPTAREASYRFTAADFELVSSAGDAGEKDAIRFREGGRRPIPGSRLTVNYYPVQTDPVPLTDLNVGSVVRTLLETIAREMAVGYLHLQHVYDSAFLETAGGDSLDKVVALVGVRRLAAGHPVARLRFSRRPATPGTITIPVGIPVTDDKGNRYLTLEQITLEPNESEREVLAGGESAGTAEVAEGALDRLERIIAGISEVKNPKAARRLAADETDEELRRRARGALHGTVRGTNEALRFGLLSIAGVRDVTIVEAPNQVAGEVRIEVAYADDSAETRAEVARRIETLRPAGIRVLAAEAGGLRTAVRIELVCAGATLPARELGELTSSIEEKVAEALSRVAPGGRVRRGPLISLVLSDPRVVDVKLTLTPEGAGEAEEIALPSGTVMAPIRPFAFPAPVFEQAGAAQATKSKVDVLLPVRLKSGVTLEAATSALTAAVQSHLATRRSDAPLTADALIAAARDESRYVLVRREVMISVETGTRFLQLTDGSGTYTPEVSETLELGRFDVDPREGGL